MANIYADGVLIGNTNTVQSLPRCTDEVSVQSAEGQWVGRIQLQEGTNQMSVALSPNRQTMVKSQGVPANYAMESLNVGRFWMGSTSFDVGRNRDEEQHQVLLTQPFMIGRAEVTQGLWTSVTGANPSRNLGCGTECPVENIFLV